MFNDRECKIGLGLVKHYVMKNGPRYLSRYSEWLRAGRSGDRIPVGGEIFSTRPDRPWVPPSILYNGYRVFTGGKERPVRAVDHSSPSIAVIKKE